MERSPLTEAYINRIATAVPEHDVHQAFVDFADGMLEDPRVKPVFQRMAQRSGIGHRYSVLTPDRTAETTEFVVNAHEFYRLRKFPETARRMEIFEKFAPALARKALDRLALSEEERRGVTHVIVTSCTGLYAPGLDFDVVDYLGLDTTVERTVIGFMGCYAAINALKMARHMVRSEPGAKVLTVSLELCTLHMQETQELEQVLSFLVFADGCAVSLVSAEPVGFRMDSFKSVVIPGTQGVDYVADSRRGVRHAAVGEGAGGDWEGAGGFFCGGVRRTEAGGCGFVGGASGRKVGAGCGGERPWAAGRGTLGIKRGVG